MPLPLILIGAAAVAGLLYGGKKAADAYSDHTKAKKLGNNAEELLTKADRKLKGSRKACAQQLKELGRLKFAVWDCHLGRFVSLFEQLRNVEVSGNPEVEQLDWSPAVFAKMKELSGYSNEVVTGGLSAVGTGALAGMATFGGATMFAAASTGTAIGSLSGVAATNATLAWFGGGALSAGGMGMAGGVAVLGGIVAAPVLAVGGAVLAAKARENLANARSNFALARKQAGEMKAAGTSVKGIHAVAIQFHDVISKMDRRLTPVLDGFEVVVAENGTDFAQYPEDAKRQVYLAVQFAQCAKALLEAPILTKDGALDERHQDALESGRGFLKSYPIVA